MSIATSVRGVTPRDKKSFYHFQEVSALCTYPVDSKAPFKKSALLPGLAFSGATDLADLPRPNSALESLTHGLTVEGLLQALPTGVVILDNQGKVRQCNPVAEKLLGSGLLEAYWREVIAANFNPRDDDGHEVSLISGRRVSLMTRSLLEGEGQLIVINDLSETRELQNQLNRHQRLSAMGQMMSSLAHQIRTPLTAALLHADNLTASNSGNEKIQHTGQKIISRLHNIERQIRDMLVFAKGGTTATTKLPLSLLTRKLKEAATDLARSYGATIIWQCPEQPATLNCNPDALVGAFLNLLENAIQASDRSKPIHAEIKIQPAEPKYQNSRLLIRVTDSGSGIDAELLEKLEEPFNSTKPNGTGLGLAVVKLVCKSHGGEFRFTPREIGARAEMALPFFNTGADL
jgi:two-component system sensor histidine kinase FlrB